MLSLKELKKTMEEKQNLLPPLPVYDHASLDMIIKKRTRVHTQSTIHYFWASFTLQVLVYALLSHALIKYWNNTNIRWLSMGGIVLYLPFTMVLLRKIKTLATIQPSREENLVASLYDFVLRKQRLLSSFYTFKKWYELFLIPLSTATGVVVIFELYIPDGVGIHLTGASIIFVLAILSCAAAIRLENKKSFEAPIRQLQDILDQFKQFS